MKTALRNINTAYLALVRFADKYPICVSDGHLRETGKLLVCVHAINAEQQRPPCIGLYRDESRVIFEVFGRDGWKVEHTEGRMCHYWSLHKIVDGVRLDMSITGEEDPILMLLEDTPKESQSGSSVVLADPQLQ